MFLKMFFVLFYFQITNKCDILESKQQNLDDQEIETNIKFFVAKENLSFEEVKEAEVLLWGNSNKKKYSHLARFARIYLLAPSFSV